MTDQAKSHPSREQWRAFVEGSLPGDEREALAQHLRGCPACQRESAEVVAEVRDAETRDGAAPVPLGAEDEEAAADERTQDNSPRALERRAAKEESLATPERLGRYLVIDTIGAGGMGEVLLAYDPSLDRRVAIKVVSREASKAYGLDVRLEREAQALARATDRHVVAVYDTGRVDGRPWVAMEYVPGTTLKAWLKQPRERKDVLRVFTEAAKGLAAAHRVGVVHRDVKPDNVLLDEHGVAHVTDFGLATFRGDSRDSSSADSALREHAQGTGSFSVFTTQHGAVLGTPAYMPPEQWDAEPTDARSDQFSFCIALHEALLRERPFFKPEVRGSRPTFERTPSSLKKLKEQPRPLRALLTRGLAVEPGERFASMEEVLSLLARAQRPSRAPWYAAAAVLVVLAVPGVALALRSPCHGALDRAAAPRLQLGTLPADIAQPATRAGEEIERLWAAAWTQACVETHERREQPPEVLALRNGCLNRQLRRYELVLGGFTSDDAKARADALVALETGPLAVDCLDVDSLLGVSQPPAARAEEVSKLHEAVLEARVAVDLGRYPDARKQLAQLTQPVTAIGYDRLLAEHSFTLGLVAQREADFRGAREHYHRALGAALSARDLELAVLSGAELLHVSGAELGYAQEAQLADAQLGPLVKRTNSQVLDAKLALVRGNVELKRARLDEAQRLYEHALAVRKTVYGPRHIETARVLDNLANVATRRDRAHDAEPLVREALAIVEEQLGAKHPQVAREWLVLAWVLTRQGRYDEAIEAARHALAIRSELLGATNRMTQATRSMLAEFTLTAGRFDEARALFNEALKEAKPGTADEGAARMDLARVDFEAGLLKEALAGARAARDLVTPQAQDNPARLLEARTLEATVLLKQGDAAGAEAIFAEVAAAWRLREGAPLELAAALVWRAEAAAARGKADAALTLVGEALAVYGTVVAKAEHLAKADFVRARALYALGRKEEALTVARQARASLEGRPVALTLANSIEAWLAKPNK